MDTVVFGGGVAVNRYIQDRCAVVCENHGFKLKRAADEYCGDNGVNIAYVGLRKHMQKHASISGSLAFNPRWSVGKKQDFVQSTRPRPNKSHAPTAEI
jgi:tRNA A37 threonylcarbamoyltransferase TsaD